MKTHEQFTKELYSINKDILVIGTYKNAHERIAVKCLKCGHEWNPFAYSLLQGRGCPKCAIQNRKDNNKGQTGTKTHEQFIGDLSVVNPDITVISTYKNTHTNVKCKCSICEHEWSAKPYSLLQGHGCPKCAKSGTSFMEQFILRCFQLACEDIDILSRNKSAIRMELDIFIPTLNFAIEIGNWFLHSKSLSRDNEKRTRCSNEGIRLITIYDQFPENKKKPFDTDCIVTSERLNASNTKPLLCIVYQLFEYVGIGKRFIDSEILAIEQYAINHSKRMTHEIFVERAKSVYPDIEVIGKYIDSSIRIHVRCKKCGHEWYALTSNFLAGDGCRHCGSKIAHEPFIKSQESFVSEVKKANPDIEVIGEYIGRHKPVKARCKICGHEWYPQASSLLRGSNHKGWKTIHANLKK